MDVNDIDDDLPPQLVDVSAPALAEERPMSPSEQTHPRVPITIVTGKLML